MNRSNWFNEMCDKAPHTSHITHSVRNGLHLIVVFEDEAGIDLTNVPSNGKGVLHCAVVNRSHRREASVSFSSRRTRGAMKFSHTDPIQSPSEGECVLRIFKIVELKAIDLVFECAMDVEVDDAKVPQEIFLTTPTVDEFRSRAKGRVKETLTTMHNIVSISRSTLSETSLLTGITLSPAIAIIPETSTLMLPRPGDSTPSTDGKLTGKQYEQLRDALVDAFPQGSLAQFVRFKLEVDLNTIASGCSIQETAFKLIEYCEARGLTSHLLASACEYNPHNAKLLAMAQELNLKR